MSNNLNAIYGASKVHERTLPNVYYVDLEAVTNGTGTMASPYNTLSAITFASNMTVKLKRGTTATLTSGINISNLNNFVLSSYGEGLKPILSFTHSGNYLIRLNNCTNSSITSIDFTTPFTEGGSQAVGCGIALGSGTNFLGGTGNIIANCKVSKNDRIVGLQPFFNNGQILIKPSMVELERELLMFPKAEHDDVIDALSMQMSFWRDVFEGEQSKQDEKLKNDPFSFENIIGEIQKRNAMQNSYPYDIGLMGYRLDNQPWRRKVAI